MSNKDWTWDDYEYLYRNYNIKSNEEISAYLERSISSIVVHAEKLGLFRKSSYSRKDLSLAKEYKKQLGTALVFLLPEYSTSMMEGLIACAK